MLSANALNLDQSKMLLFSLNRKKTLWQKEKMLVSDIFSFTHSVFKSPLFQGYKKSRLWDKVFGTLMKMILENIVHSEPIS